MTPIVSTLLGLSGPAVYAVIMLLVFLEAAFFVGLVLPGETALVVAGFLAARGAISLPLIAGSCAVAAVAGDSVGYWIGHRFGPAIEQTRLGRWVGAERWEKARAYVQHHGSWAVVGGRWVGLLRALLPATVGMTRMPYGRFLAANVVGGLTWVGAVLALGYGVGASVGGLATASTPLMIIGAAVLAFMAVVAGVVWVRRRGAPDSPALPAPPAEHPPAPPRHARRAALLPSLIRPALATLAGIALLAGAAFVELVDAVRERDDLAALDPGITGGVVAERSTALTTVADVLTGLGGPIGLGILTAALLAWLMWRGRPRIALLVGATMAASLGLTVALKALLGRDRPPADLVLGVLDPSSAFSSGHTLNSTVLFGLIAALACSHVRRLGARIAIIAS